VTYTVRAHRDSAVSDPCPVLTVYFGVVPEGTIVSANGQVIGTIGNEDPLAEAA